MNSYINFHKRILLPQSLIVLHQPSRTRLYSKMKLTLFALFCLEVALATTPSKAVLEDWEVRPEPRY